MLKGGKSDDQYGPRGLDHAACQGSRITVAEVRDACEAGGMKVLETEGEGTQYLWVKAMKA